MLGKEKLPVVLLIVIIVLSLAMAGGVFYFLQQERAKNLALQDDLQEIKTKQKITETKLQDAQKVISDLEVQLREAKGQIDTLTSGLQQEKTAKEQAVGQIEQLRGELEQQKRLRVELEGRLSQAQDNLKKINSQLETLETKRTELEGKIKDLETKTEGIELGKIVVNSETPQAPVEQITAPIPPTQQSPVAPTVVQRRPVAGLEGKVLVVNEEYNFVVINLGSKDGISVNDVFVVSRDNAQIGEIKVEKVHDAMSAAGFSSKDLKGKIREGDKVARKS
jgi:predicted  nucleic acid-binding Zn-ribbon protein